MRTVIQIGTIATAILIILIPILILSGCSDRGLDREIFSRIDREAQG